MFNFMLLAHSAGRWIVLLLLLIAIFRSLTAGNRPFNSGDRKTGTMLTIFADIMLLIGVYLYFAGNTGYAQVRDNGMSEVMKNDTARFFAVEHLAGMLIAIILLHIGKSQGKKAITDRAKHRRSAIFYLIGLLVILATIPWPFREVGAGRGWM
jgi:hypothetical protein